MEVDAGAELAVSGETEYGAPTCAALLVSEIHTHRERERERERFTKCYIPDFFKVFGKAEVVSLRTG